jgi:hypothetical protein
VRTEAAWKQPQLSIGLTDSSSMRDSICFGLGRIGSHVAVCPSFVYSAVYSAIKTRHTDDCSWAQWGRLRQAIAFRSQRRCGSADDESDLSPAALQESG